MPLGRLLVELPPAVSALGAIVVLLDRWCRESHAATWLIVRLGRCAHRSAEHLALRLPLGHLGSCQGLLLGRGLLRGRCPLRRWLVVVVAATNGPTAFLNDLLHDGLLPDLLDIEDLPLLNEDLLADLLMLNQSLRDELPTARGTLLSLLVPATIGIVLVLCPSVLIERQQLLALLLLIRYRFLLLLVLVASVLRLLAIGVMPVLLWLLNVVGLALQVGASALDLLDPRSAWLLREPRSRLYCRVGLGWLSRFDSASQDNVVDLLNVGVHLCWVEGLPEVLILVLLLLLLARAAARWAHGLSRRVTARLIQIELPLSLIVLNVGSEAWLLLARHPVLEQLKVASGNLQLLLRVVLA